MLSNQVIQKTVENMKSITTCDISIWNRDLKCVSTTVVIEPEVEKIITEHVELSYHGKENINQDLSIFNIMNDLEPVYALVMHGMKEDAGMIGRLCVSQFEGLITAYKERLDKNHFIQNLLLDNLLLVDIYNKARRLNIPVEERRIVYLIEPKKEEDSIVMETMKGLYATSLRDFITAVDEGHIIFIKTLHKTEGEKDILHIADTIKDTLSAEAMVNVRVAYGTVVNELNELPRAYKEAGMALEIGRIFFAERNVLNYARLGIGRLIYQLPETLCGMFLNEVLKGNAMEHFDEETLVTVYKFLDNNLNISETARQLYIHRNTLVYRLEKIQKITGLDVRAFDDAMTFKIALMVAGYMNFLHYKK